MAKVLVSEYDLVDGCTECVHFSYHDIADITPAGIRRFLAAGDYEGGSERFIKVEIDERILATYTAPEIRRAAAALRGSAKRYGRTVTTGC